MSNSKRKPDSKRVLDLRSRVGDAERKLAEARSALYGAMVEEAGVKVGDIVIYRGAEFQVCKIEPQSWTVWVMGNPRRKDGSWSASVRHLFDDWTRAEIAQ